MTMQPAQTVDPNRVLRELDTRFFGGRLREWRALYVPSLPYGRAHALTLYDQRVILVRRPSKAQPPLRDLLLHEAVHAHLYEAGLPHGHDSKQYCDEVVRLTKHIWGMTVQAAPQRVEKDENRRSVRRSPAGSLSRADVAGWPWILELSVPPLRIVYEAAGSTIPTTGTVTPSPGEAAPQPVPKTTKRGAPPRPATPEARVQQLHDRLDAELTARRSGVLWKILARTQLVRKKVTNAGHGLPEEALRAALERFDAMVTRHLERLTGRSKP